MIKTREEKQLEKAKEDLMQITLDDDFDGEKLDFAIKSVLKILARELIAEGRRLQIENEISFLENLDLRIPFKVDKVYALQNQRKKRIEELKSKLNEMK